MLFYDLAGLRGFSQNPCDATSSVWPLDLACEFVTHWRHSVIHYSLCLLQARIRGVQGNSGPHDDWRLPKQGVRHCVPRNGHKSVYWARFHRIRAKHSEALTNHVGGFYQAVNLGLRPVPHRRPNEAFTNHNLYPTYLPPCLPPRLPRPTPCIPLCVTKLLACFLACVPAYLLPNNDH